MNFALGATANLLLLVCTVNAHETEATEDVVFFRPLLKVKQDNVSSSHEHTNIWMEIQKGIYPNISSTDKGVKVGEPITLVIYLSDQNNQSLVVDECWAYNEENYNNSTNNSQLTNKDSDFQKSILINKSYSNTQNITTVLYKYLISFKFPEKEYVYITCSVELCYRSCSKDSKQRRFPTKLKNISAIVGNQPQLASMDNVNFLFRKSKPPPLFTTKNALGSNCTPKSKHILCLLKPPSQCTPSSTNVQCKPPTNCNAGSDDPKCHGKPPTDCYTGSANPQCNANYPPACYPGSKDKQCQTFPAICKPGSENPQCNSGNSPNCYPGSEDPQCYFNSVVPNCYPGSQNSQCNISSSNCYPGSQNPQCGFIPPPNCSPGSQDAECNFNVPQCYPGSQYPLCKFLSSWDLQSNSTTQRNCFQGSKDPLCGLNSSTTDTYVSRNSGTILNKNDPKQSILCFYNILNPRCQHVRKKRSKSTNTAAKSTSPSPHIINIQPKLSSPDCSSHAIDPRCALTVHTFLKSTTESTVPIKCVSGFHNGRCIAETSTYKKLLYNPFLPPNCYPSSQDPRCEEPVTDENDGSIIQSTYSPLKPPNCYPGSKDPRCTKF